MKTYNNYLENKPKNFILLLKQKYIGSRLNLFINYEVIDVEDDIVVSKKKDSQLIFIIKDVTYHQDKMNGFHVFRLIKDDKYKKYIDIVIDPKEPDYPKSLYLEIDNFHVNIYNWKEVLDDFLMQVNEYYL